MDREYTGSVCIHPVICNPMMIKRQESVLCTSKKHYHRLSDSVPRGGGESPRLINVNRNIMVSLFFKARLALTNLPSLITSDQIFPPGNA